MGQCNRAETVSSYIYSQAETGQCEKLGNFLGKQNGETEIRKLNKAEQFEQFTARW